MSDRTPLLLKDGTILSVQGSSTHNCSPRADNPDKGYGSVEIKIESNPNDFNNGDIESWATPQFMQDYVILQIKQTKYIKRKNKMIKEMKKNE